MPTWEQFLWGGAGALLTYVALALRGSRLRHALGSSSLELRPTLFELIVYLVGGGLASIFVGPTGLRGAMIVGMGWERIVDRYIPKTDLAVSPSSSNQAEGEDEDGWTGTE